MDDIVERDEEGVGRRGERGVAEREGAEERNLGNAFLCQPRRSH